MKSENKIVQSLFSYGELNDMHRTAVKSFLKHGHTYHLYTYGGVKNVPEGVILKDANEIIPEDQYFTTENKDFKGIHAAFSDLFRYQLLYLRGGWWVDTDVVCLRPFDMDQQKVICSVYHGDEDKVRASTFVLKFPPNDPFLKKAWTLSLEKVRGMDQYEEVGPMLMRKLVEEEKESGSLAPYHYFSPVSWYNTYNSIVFKQASLVHTLKMLLRPVLKPKLAKAMHLHKDSFGVHLWGEMWRGAGINANERFAQKCLFEQLKKQYLN
jgi:hypothetical protein